jgi:hypothetical protein
VLSVLGEGCRCKDPDPGRKHKRTEVVLALFFERSKMLTGCRNVDTRSNILASLGEFDEHSVGISALDGPRPPPPPRR